MAADPFAPDFAGSGVIVTVTWGGQVHGLEIDAADWALILSGAGLELPGDDFVMQDDDFETEWDFGGGSDGVLAVRYTRIDDDEWETGFSGRLSDARVAALP